MTEDNVEITTFLPFCLLPSLFCSLVYHKVTTEMSERLGTFCCWPCFSDSVELSCSLFILSNRSLVSFMSFVLLLLNGNRVERHPGKNVSCCFPAFLYERNFYMHICEDRNTIVLDMPITHFVHWSIESAHIIAGNFWFNWCRWGG